MNRNYWIHRISYHAEYAYPLLERNLLSIGFSDFSSKDFIIDTKNNWNNFDKWFDKEWGSRPKSRYTLWRFLFEMKRGDFVVVPSWGTFSIYEFEDDEALTTTEIDINGLVSWSNILLRKGNKEDDFLYSEEKEPKLIDLGFFRRVKLVAHEISSRLLKFPNRTISWHTALGGICGEPKRSRLMRSAM